MPGVEIDAWENGPPERKAWADTVMVDVKQGYVVRGKNSRTDNMKATDTELTFTSTGDGWNYRIHLNRLTGQYHASYYNRDMATFTFDGRCSKTRQLF